MHFDRQAFACDRALHAPSGVTSQGGLGTAYPRIDHCNEAAGIDQSLSIDLMN
jgi:hypothetical protein